MEYLIQQFQWDEEDGLKYYHLVDSKVFKSDKPLEEKSYHKDKSLFEIVKLD